MVRTTILLVKNYSIIKISNNEYVEFAKVFGNYYGSLHKNVMDLHNNGYHVLFDIDWQGAKQLKSSNYSDILSFFIIPPSKKSYI